MQILDTNCKIAIGLALGHLSRHAFSIPLRNVVGTAAVAELKYEPGIEVQHEKFRRIRPKHHATLHLFNGAYPEVWGVAVAAIRVGHASQLHG